MKRLFAILTTLILFSMACSLTGNDPEAQPAPQSENRCGDQVCDGPENFGNCPADCPAVGVAGNRAGADQEDGTASEEQPAQQESSESGYRYVSFGGMVSTMPNTTAMGDFSGIAFGYSGDYQIELWFPLEGGEVVQQRNTITLTEFNDLYFNSAPCVWELDESAFEPVSFDLVASLTLNAYQESGKPADDLSYQLVAIPQAVIGGVVQCEGSPGNFSDPATFPVLTSWLTISRSNPIQLNVIESNSLEHESVNPINWIDIPEETLSYVIVPDLETP